VFNDMYFQGMKIRFTVAFRSAALEALDHEENGTRV